MSDVMTLKMIAEETRAIQTWNGRGEKQATQTLEAGSAHAPVAGHTAVRVPAAARMHAAAARRAIADANTHARAVSDIAASKSEDDIFARCLDRGRRASTSAAPLQLR